MIFDELLLEEAEDLDIDSDDIDAVLPQDPDTEEGLDAIADQVEDAMQAQALECADYFENGDEAIQEFFNSPEVQACLNEAFSISGKDKKRTFVRLGRKDDLRRRAHLASLFIARDKGDPLFKKMTKFRHEERRIRKLIFKKYMKPAIRVAKKSQRAHLREKKKFRLPFFAKKEDNK